MAHLWYFYKQLHQYAGPALYITLLVMGLMSLLEGFAVLLLIPLISTTGIIDFHIEGSVLSSIVTYLEKIPALLGGLPGILALYLILVFFQQLLSRRIQIHHAALQHGFFQHLRVKTYGALLKANWRFFRTHRNSDLIHILTAETARASAGTHSFLQLLSQFFFTLIQIGIAFWLSPSITVFLILSGAILLLFSRGFLKRSVALGSRNFTLGEEYLAGITDHINGMKDVKSNTLETSRLNWYKKVTNQMRSEQMEYTRLKSTSQMYYKIASSVLTVLLIFIALQLFQAQAAQLLLIIVIFSRLWPRVTSMQGAMEQIAAMLPAFKEVRSLTEKAEAAKEWETEQVPPALIINKEIRIEKVSFSYEGDKKALNEAAASFPVNQMTAVVGKSGAGKSTLIDLLLGLHRPQEGAILIDDKELTNESIPALRETISYVPQDPFLFHGSVKENMQLVRPEATEEDIWEALRFASAADFIANLPQGLDTMLGDRGIRLSGGERQRLVLARAVLRKTPILILDEATSSLDAENEYHIQRALENMRGRMTVIVIAHRLSTIRHADQVIVLEEGRIIQQGGYQKLAHETSGAFHHLLQKQQV
ncbi:ABC transporter ATP-binding protein [Alkalicoccus daliensis]|uniref:ABC-type multidrug transport system, ATPase and permease component n=1 Tax=Alkalicoccus daliensis TaxID=745820 RepID=A0A1H0G0A1_9BACI|nr:ABC transporter ATP-binding protein [Alkalicoccus daliensis]SDO00300.1 ABC-type multidrug transport system, ATPase and permease component [Alkalicoccus daliensis]